MRKDVEERALMYAAKNAIDYGTANANAVLGKVLADFPELKADVKGTATEIAQIVERINKMSRSEIEELYGKGYEANKEMLEKREQEKLEKSAKPNIAIETSSGSIATRFAPEPSGYMHIGHAKAAFVASEIAKKYSGKIFLYFDDTNPEKELQEYVDAIKRDLDWLGVKFDDEYYASDNIDKLYYYAENLIKKGAAYVCLCTTDTIKENRKNMRECEHRRQSVNENLELWKKMLNDAFEDNVAVLRFKGDMKAQNTVMRDPTLFRIKHHAHYRQGNKYRVWPTYDFNTPINDSLHGVTDAIRSKEYELRDELYYRILDELELRKPKIHSFSRLEILDNTTKKREINQLVAKGLISGYDDPRLVTISGLRRRGIAPEAIKRFVLRFGLSKVESKVKIDMLLSENRKIIDPVSKRLFFVAEPVMVKVMGIDKLKVSIPLHPQNDMGNREYVIGNTLYISKNDASALKPGEIVKLKDAYDIEVEKVDATITAKYVERGNADAKRIQWVDEGNFTNATLLVPGDLIVDGKFNPESLKRVPGYVEKYAEQLGVNEVVQFERVGFAKLDDKEKMVFIGL